MRLRHLGAIAVGLTLGCLRFSAFNCVDGGQCNAHDDGVCTAEGFCAYPDSSCPELLRYDEHAGAGFAEACVARTGASGNGSDTLSFAESTDGTATGHSATGHTTQGGGSEGESDSDGRTTTGEVCGGQGQACCGSSCNPGLACNGTTCGCVEQVVAGELHTCAVLSNGELHCWGSNQRGQLGPSVTGQLATTPMLAYPVVPEDPVVEVAAANHTCVGRARGGHFCWGDNQSGQVTPESDAVIAPPTAVTWTPSTIEQLAIGLNHTCARGEAGVACWGDNADSQLTGTQAGPGPVLIAGSGVTALALGRGHTCVNQGGVPHCWGANEAGQTGADPVEGTTQPAGVTLPLQGVTMLAAGFSHTCAADDAGRVGCWGDNTQGQLGAPELLWSHAPVEVQGLDAAGRPAQLIAGGNQTCIVGAEGELWCWGSNQFGQLMLVPDKVGFDGYTAVPVRLDVGDKVVMAALGRTHTCALTDQSAILCWGSNNSGQLGDGTTNFGVSPTEVALVCP